MQNMCTNMKGILYVSCSMRKYMQSNCNICTDPSSNLELTGKVPLKCKYMQLYA